jgi:copper(I)-binding protein
MSHSRPIRLLAAAALPCLLWSFALAAGAPADQSPAPSDPRIIPAAAPAGLPALPSTPDSATREAAAAAAAAKANIDVNDGWARATPGNATTAAVYLRIVSVKDADRLIGAKTAMADKSEVHTSATVNGAMRMTPVPNLAIPAGGTVTFSPAGNHIMLTGLKAPLRQGDSFLVTLDFEKAGAHTAVVRIAAANAMGPPPAAAASRDITSGATEPANDR